MDNSIQTCFQIIKQIRHILVLQKNDKWIFHDTPDNYTNFLLTVNNQKISIAFNILTNGIIETVLVYDNDKYDFDTISYHEHIYELIEYLKSLS